MFRFVKFAELPVVDQDRAVRFYTGTLGLEVAQDAKYGDDWRWIELAVPGAETRILLARRAGPEPRATPCLILVARDVQATAAALKAKGVAFTQEPTDAPWKPGETYALFRDSEENIVMIGSG
jgi:lactoylglutathione lyase